MDSLRGKLLIAPPTLVDPNFTRTVVLVAAHDDNGALGLVLNRPLDTPLAEISPVLDALAEPGSMLHSGGPVAPDELWQPDCTQLWATALRRKGGSYALLARMPADPSVN